MDVDVLYNVVNGHRRYFGFLFYSEIFNSTTAKVDSGLLQIDPAHRWNFSQTFFEKNQNKKVNNGTLQEREQAKIVDVR